jgi:hypothetical protein
MMNKFEKYIFIVLFLFIIYPAFASPAASLQAKHEYSWTCYFGKYGAVTIDTRNSGPSIIIAGVRHPAKSGSYFYQTTDGKLVFAFNAQMTAWTYLSAQEPKGVTDAHCKIVGSDRRNLN